MNLVPNHVHVATALGVELSEALERLARALCRLPERGLGAVLPSDTEKVIAVRCQGGRMKLCQ